MYIDNKKRNFEFDAELEDHKMDDKDLYRLYFMEFNRIGLPYSSKANIEVVDWPYKPFKLPSGMTKEDAFKVLSYLTDYIEKDNNIAPASFKSVRILDDILNIERLGFKRIDTNLSSDSSDVINLFTISGRIRLFKKHKLYNKYFEWYKEGVTKEDVVEIYKNCNVEFYDLEKVSNAKTIGCKNNKKQKNIIK